MAGPGFPVGGHQPQSVGSLGSYVLKILYVETKESGPLGGRAHPQDPPMSNAMRVGR